MNSMLLNLVCFLILTSAFCVVSSRNALHSIVFLVSTFLFSAFTIFSLENEFLALFFIIIYVGAILVLFIFVLMMLDLKHNILKLSKTHLPVGVAFGVVSFFYMLSLSNEFFVLGYNLNVTEFTANPYTDWQNLVDQKPDMLAFAGVFYANYAMQIVLAGFLLYIATIGVVYLTSSRYKKSSSKNIQSLTKQLSRNNVL